MPWLHPAIPKARLRLPDSNFRFAPPFESGYILLLVKTEMSVNFVKSGSARSSLKGPRIQLQFVPQQGCRTVSARRLLCAMAMYAQCQASPYARKMVKARPSMRSRAQCFRARGATRTRWTRGEVVMASAHARTEANGCRARRPKKMQCRLGDLATQGPLVILV